MRKEEAKAHIDEMVKKLQECKWDPLYIDGLKEGCETFLDWLVQQGTIKQ